MSPYVEKLSFITTNFVAQFKDFINKLSNLQPVGFNSGFS
jgi:hypothetical protein